MKVTVQFELNGKQERFSYETDKTLLWVLRTDFGLTGTKFGCGEGFCGSCTVLIDNEPIRACQVPVSYVRGKKILTIEGLSRNGALHPLQEAFAEHDALQCGYCTPGMIMSAYGLLIKSPQPTRDEIIREMENNLCRCGTYGRIIEAILTAAEKMKGRVAV